MKLGHPVGFLIAIALAGCSSIPRGGPTTSQVIEQAAKDGRAQFDLVNVDSRVVGVLAARPGGGFRAQFGNYGKPPNPTIGVGDSVSVLIWQSTGAGVLGGTAAGALPPEAGGLSQSMTIPDQVVAADGAISVPNAGRLRAAGRTPLQIQRAIEHALADRAIEPQAIVTVAKSVSNSVTVSGEVVSGARVPLSVRGDRLLDVIAAAGGVKSPLYETSVRLTRDGSTVTGSMDSLVSNPEENVYAWPGDVITLVRAPQTFSVFGATLDNKLIPFNADRITLAQAVAKAGGLQDARADPAGVFLLRFEPPPVVAALGEPVLATAPTGQSPVLYHVDMEDMSGYFLASRFPVQNDDMIYVANASLTDLQKFFTLVGTITGPAIGAAVLSRGR